MATRTWMVGAAGALLGLGLWLASGPAAAQEAPGETTGTSLGAATSPAGHPAAAVEPVGSGDPGVGTASPAEPLTLAQVYALARARSPRLAASSAMAQAAEARVPGAGLPPDPQLQLGVMNFSLPGLRADMPSSMAPSLQLMQMLPVPGKLGLAKRVQERTADMARASADEAWWEVRSRSAMAFYDIYSADEQTAVMRRTLRLLEDDRQVAQAMYASGEGHQADVLRAGVEVAKMQADLARMQAMREVAVARLNGVLDRAADTPVGSVTLAPLPAELPAADTLMAWAEQSRPALARGREAVQRADAQGQLARKAIWPDLALGVQYGQRASDMGTQRMGSAMVGVSVPLFAGSRQLRLRDEAAAARGAAEADLTQQRADVRARLGELTADLVRARTLVRLYRGQVLPQAQATVESALSSYRVGTVDFMTLVDAQMTANRYEQELYALLAGYGADVAALESTIGRELPATGKLLAEVR